MKKLLPLLGLTILIGCAAPNPTYNAQQQTTASNAPYAPNKTATDVSGVAAVVSQVTPPPWGTIIGAVGTLIGAIAGAVAYQKNNQAIANAATTTQLATSIAAQGPVVAQAITDHASNTPQATQVFTAINGALPPDKVVPPTS